MQATQVIQALALKAKGTTVTSAQIQQLLSDVRGVTFAQIVSVTDVKPGKDHKTVSIKKVASSNVQLFNNVKNHEVYQRAVQRNTGAKEWEAGETWYQHTDCFSLVEHKSSKEQYLYAIYNGARSVYLVNGVQATRAEVAVYLNASDARTLMGDGTTYNVTNDVHHSVIVRVLKLSSIVSIRAMGDTLSV